MPKLEEVLQPSAPFKTKIPRTGRKRNRKWVTGLIYGDTHGNMFQNDKVLEVVFGIMADLQPDIVVHLGDLMDAYPLSEYDKNPDRPYLLQAEVDWARAHLHQVSQIVPEADKYLLEGNHEKRLSKALWRMSRPAQNIAMLDTIREQIEWPKILRTDEVGWAWVPENKQSKTSIFPKLITKHGTSVTKWSAGTAKNEWIKYGHSGISGHTHRLGTFIHRDYNGNHIWMEAGCTCAFDPEYMTDPDWANGVVIYRGLSDGSRFQLEDIFIDPSGKAIWTPGEPKLYTCG